MNPEGLFPPALKYEITALYVSSCITTNILCKRIQQFILQMHHSFCWRRNDFYFFPPLFLSILGHSLNPSLNKIISRLIRTLEFIVTGTKQQTGKGKVLGISTDNRHSA